MTISTITGRKEQAVGGRLTLVFLSGMFGFCLLFQYSNLFKSVEEQNINRFFQVRPWIKWSQSSINKVPLIWQYHEQHEIPRSLAAWDYTLSWLIEDNHPPIKERIVIFNHLIEDEPPADAIFSHPWLKPLLSFPLKRANYAEWITFLSRSGAKAIVLDCEFPQYSSDDGQLAKAIFESSEGISASHRVPVIFARTINLRTQGNLVGALGASSNGLTTELSKLDSHPSSKYSGLAGVILDDDQIVRRAIARMDTQVETLDSIPLKILKKFNPEAGNGLPDHFIVDFSGGANSELYPVRPLTYLLDPSKRKLLSSAPDANGDVSVKDAIVFIGDGITDIFNTSTSNFGVSPMSGPELLANVVDTISRRSWLTEVSGVILFGYLLWISLCASLAILASKSFQSKLPQYKNKPLSFWIADFGLLCVMLFFTFAVPALAFAYCNLILPVFSVALSTVLASVIVTLRERDYVRDQAYEDKLKNEREKLVLAGENHKSEMEAQAARANLLLVERDHERRREFATRLNHDIRGPASSINWTLMRLGREKVSELVGQKLELLARNAQVLIELVDELVKTYREEATGLSGVAVGSVDLNDIARQCVFDNQALADQRRGSLVFRSSADNCFIDVDGKSLSRAIANLIRNAFLHNDCGVEVVVKIENPGEIFRLSVEDDGRGIPSDKLKNIFIDGYSSGAGAALKEIKEGQTSGVHEGLGLGIVCKIVHDAGATISVESELGQGTIFKIDFVCRSTDAVSDNTLSKNDSVRNLVIPAGEVKKKTYG